MSISQFVLALLSGGALLGSCVALKRRFSAKCTIDIQVRDKKKPNKPVADVHFEIGE